MKRKNCKWKRLIALMLVLVLGIQVTASTVSVQASDTSTVTVSYDVTYYQTNARSMLEMINEFRTGDDTWYWN